MGFSDTEAHSYFCMRTRRPPPRSSLGPLPYSDPCDDLIWQWPLQWCVQTSSVPLTSISNCWLDISPWISQQELQFNMPPVEWFILNCGSFFLSVFLIASSHSCHPESWSHLPPASRVREICYQPPSTSPFPLLSWFRPQKFSSRLLQIVPIPPNLSPSCCRENGSSSKACWDGFSFPWRWNPAS